MSPTSSRSSGHEHVAVSHRPAAVGAERRRLVALTWTLAATDFKLRFYGSVLGYAWTLVRPFAFFGVIYVVFAEIVGLGEGVPNYPAYILVALVLFQYFLGVVTGCLSSLVDRANLLRKIRFPRLVIPLAVVLGGLFELGLTFVAVLGFLLISGVYPAWSWLQLIPLVAIVTDVRDRSRPPAERPLRALPRHQADLGRRRADALLRVADPLRRDDGARRLPAARIS